MIFQCVTLNQLLAIMPLLKMVRAAYFLEPINAAMQEFGIDTPARQAAFLAQIAHESAALTYTRELADGSAYDNRADLGNTRPEAIAIAQANSTTPGRLFKGRGLIQITGFDNYEACSLALFDDAFTLTHNPVLLERKELAARSAAWFWHENGLNRFADVGDFDGVSDLINRGRKTTRIGDANGYADRLAYFNRAQSALVA